MESKKLLKVLGGEPQDIRPIWLMRQAGRYLPEYRAIREKFPDFMTFCFTPETVAEVTLQPISRFDFDAAIIFSDILVIPHLLGQAVHFEKNHGPVLEPVNWTTFLPHFEEESLADKLENIQQGIHLTRSALDSNKALIGFAGAPWTLATYMVSAGKTKDFQDVINFAESNPLVFCRLIKALTKHIITLLCAHIQAGADVVQIFDSWAKAVPQQFVQDWIITPLENIVAGVRKKFPSVPIIFFGKGASSIYNKLSHLNIAFGIDEHQDIGQLNLPSTAVIQGNLCPQKLVSGDFERDVKHILEATKGIPHIFNLGHGILPATPLAHVEKLIQLIRA